MMAPLAFLLLLLRLLGCGTCAERPTKQDKLNMLGSLATAAATHSATTGDELTDWTGKPDASANPQSQRAGKQPRNSGVFEGPGVDMAAHARPADDEEKRGMDELFDGE